MASSGAPGWLLALFGLNRAGKVLYGTLFALALPAFLVWTVVLPRMRFSGEDERLFRAARHGDVAGIEQSLQIGAGVNDRAPTDRKTALFRAAVFGYADAVKALLAHGADPEARGADGRTALEVVTEALGEEKNPEALKALDAVAAVLRNAEPKR
ncbi:MAG TPA: ankyrin repeat domain-containing protein [Vicinamibacterales bacterium]|nr:ankyrin repeat domain-containing protein [Vicinamibacterales bacterium]